MGVYYSVLHTPSDPMRRAWVTDIQRAIMAGMKQDDVLYVHYDRAGSRNPLKQHTMALKRVSPSYSHLVQIQDDVKLSMGFTSAIRAIARAFPDAATVLYRRPDKRLDRLNADGWTWVRTDGLFYGPLFMVPVAWLPGFIRFSQDIRAIDPAYRHDDAAWGLYCRLHELPTYLSTWSLGDHLGQVKSLLTPANSLDYVAGNVVPNAGTVDWARPNGGVPFKAATPIAATKRLERMLRG